MKSIAKNWIHVLPVYEPGKPIEELARELGCENPDEIDKLASNENPLGPSPLAVKAIKKAAARMHLYPDGSAYYLHRALAAKLNVKQEQVLAANGSNELLEFIGHIFLGPETNAVAGDRAFIIYRLIAKLFQSRVILAPMPGFTHDLDAMLAAVTPETRVIFLANPNNPTGTMVRNDAIERFMDRLPEHVVACFDEAYLDLLDPAVQPDTLRYVREGRRVILLRTMSKSHGLAGLRIGYAVAPEDAIALMSRVRQPFNVNAMAQAAAVAALDDDRHVARTRRIIASGLAFFEKNLAAMGIPFVPSVVNFMMVDVGNGREVFQALQKQRVIVRPLDAYDLPRHVRISIGRRDENERCIAALARVLGKDLPAARP